MNYLHIKIHQTWLQASNNVPKVILHELWPCEESEYWKIRSQYENREGKYGMNNTSLDICHHITESMANKLLLKLV